MASIWFNRATVLAALGPNRQAWMKYGVTLCACQLQMCISVEKFLVEVTFAQLIAIFHSG